MRRQLAYVAGIGLCAAIAVGIIYAQNKTPAGGESPRPTDDAAIREISQSLAKAFEKGDADALAAFWTEDGEYADEGKDPVHGRAALAKAYKDFFAKRAAVKVEAKTASIRFLGKDTAVEEGTFTVTAKDTPPNSARYSTLYVRQEGKWLIAMLKEWDDDLSAQATVQDLAWLVGAWASEGAELQASTTYEWSANKKFLISRYSITAKKPGERASSGTQVIGVDPATGFIRGWLFDSEGGIGESTWTWDGERWVIDSAGTLPDGSGTTSLNFLTRAGDDGFTWKSVRRTLEGERLPDLTPVKVKRTAKQ